MGSQQSKLIKASLPCLKTQQHGRFWRAAFGRQLSGPAYLVQYISVFSPALLVQILLVSQPVSTATGVKDFLVSLDSVPSKSMPGPKINQARNQHGTEGPSYGNIKYATVRHLTCAKRLLSSWKFTLMTHQGNISSLWRV